MFQLQPGMTPGMFLRYSLSFHGTFKHFPVSGDDGSAREKQQLPPLGTPRGSGLFWPLGLGWGRAEEAAALQLGRR